MMTAAGSSLQLAGGLPSHPFRIIAFDWDGTAVANRQEDATPVRTRLEQLLAGGVSIVVITGTSFPNVDRQLSAGIVGADKRRLYVCTNRGSEVYGFDAASQPVVLWKRVATPAENRALTAVADEVRHVVEQRTGLSVQVIYDRLNRRKIDLIPVAEWAAPAKSELAGLLAAVEGRLTGAGVSGGLREVFDLTVRIAHERGLPDARITSDVKHVEVGLTDKGDAVGWIMRSLAGPANVVPADVLIVGDEFGPIAGFEGSDARMMIPAARGATFVSVGPEPNGVPTSVAHLGGGPACFRALLDAQIAALPPCGPPVDGGTQLPSPSTGRAREGLPGRQPNRIAPCYNSAWVLVGEGYVPAQEHEVESLFAVSNGYVGTRASVSEHGLLERPGVFVAGAFKDESATGSELIVAPDWADFHVFVGGEELSIDNCTILDDRRLLDMRRGVFEHVWRCRDHAGRVTRIESQRFASRADRHALAEMVRVTPENYSGRVRVDSVLDGRIATVPVSTELIGPRDQARDIACPHPIAHGVGAILTVRRDASGPDLVAFVATTCFQSTVAHDAALAASRSERSIRESWEWSAEIGLTYRVDKLVAVFSSKDGANPRDQAVTHLSDLACQGADALLTEHAAAWAERWDVADVEIGGDEAAQRAIRFALYHLISAVDPSSERVSIGARALTGESYKGHVFWDTEIFIVPTFVFTHPCSARALLMYRYHTLPGARDKARALGYRGALYPWEATETGQEMTPSWALIPGGEAIRIRTGDQEHHVNADVASAVWQYWQDTGDDGFLLGAGAEILLETARFWASRVQPGGDGRYHINQVIGPDEYHESVDDDAYTNGMARWNLERGVEVSQLLRGRWPDRWHALAEQLAISEGELNGWSEIAGKMYTGFNSTTGLFEQFQGYFGLDDLDLDRFEPRTAPIDVILGRERVARSQIIKQPDVILLIYLLWDQFPRDVREANFRYYAPRCAHGSSLSPGIHALVAARLGDAQLADRYWRQAAEVDLANNLGNAAGGVHIGAQGGLWQSTIFGIAGVRRRGDGLAFDPRVFPRWRTLAFSLRWRNRQLRVAASAEPPSIDVAVERGDSLEVTLGEGDGVRTVMEPGKRYRSDSRNGVWLPWREVRR